MISIKEKFWRLVRPARNAVIRAQQKPRVGCIDWGDFDTTRPINANWGYERGTPIDRYYIGRFLERNAGYIRGRVLEVAGNEYTEMYGGDRVERSDILHPAEGNPRATIIADLEEPSQVTDELFNCIICTQTLQLVFDVNTAIASSFPGYFSFIESTNSSPHTKNPSIVAPGIYSLSYSSTNKA